MPQHSHIQIPFNSFTLEVQSFIVQGEENFLANVIFLCTDRATQFQRHWRLGAAGQGCY